MARDVILAIGPVEAFVTARLSRFGEVIQVDPADTAGIAGRLGDSIAIMARAMALVDSDVIAAAPRLRVIARSGVGVDRIDVAAATARGIPVVITPGAGARAVAEGTMALILHLVKRLGPLTAMVRQGRWEARETVPITDLDGATLGIIGYGRIGRRVAELAATFGMNVLAYDPLVPAGSVIDANAELTDLDTLVRNSDVVSLHAPLTPQTSGMVDAELLARFKDGVVLVNCARGALLDLDGVYSALSAGRLAGVGLDVFTVEPPPPHPLFEHPNVVLSPHVLGLSRRARHAIFEAMTDGIEAVLSSRRPVDVANPDVYGQAAVRRTGGGS